MADKSLVDIKFECMTEEKIEAATKILKVLRGLRAHEAASVLDSCKDAVYAYSVFAGRTSD